MTLSKREKYIGVVAGSAVVLFILYQVVLSPYFDALDAVDKQTADAIEKQNENTDLFDRQASLKKVWTAVKKDLKADDSAAETQALGSALDFAQNAGVNITATKTERSIVVNEFVVTPFHISGLGSTPAIARLLYSFETASIPIRIEELSLTPVKEGTDNLKIELTLSTLSAKPAADAAKTTVSDARNFSEGQPWNR
jgi:hypothetical protein